MDCLVKNYVEILQNKTKAIILNIFVTCINIVKGLH